MRDEILLESTGKFLKGFPLLNKNFSEEIIENIALKIKPTILPFDIIYKVIQNFIKSFYFNKIN